MRMRRKKNLDSRMEGCAERVTNIIVKDRRFGASEEETQNSAELLQDWEEPFQEN